MKKPELLSISIILAHSKEAMKYIWLIYLQILFVAGQFNAKKNWIDKHILICYNKLDELNVDYVKYHEFDKKE